MANRLVTMDEMLKEMKKSAMEKIREEYPEMSKEDAEKESLKFMAMFFGALNNIPMKMGE